MNNNDLSSLEKTIILTLLTMLGMAILSGLFSCRGTKTVYEYKSGWNTMSKKSDVTGWSYMKK